MSTVERHQSSINRQLEAYEEAWSPDHDAAIACPEWEDAIAVGISIFHMLQEREQAWRDQVFRGAVSFADDDNLDQKSRFANWLDTTKDVLAAVLPELEKRFGKVEGAAELRTCAEWAEKILLKWQPPRLSRVVGLRDMTLSPEGAAELDRLLREAKTHPPPMPACPIPRQISEEEFFANLRRPQP